MTATITLPLLTTPQERKELNVRLEVGRMVYNSVLGEVLRRRNAYKSHPSFIEAVALLKADNEDQAKPLFSEAQKATGFYLRDAKQYGKTNGIETFVARVTKNTWINTHIDSHCRNRIAERAWTAVQKLKKGEKARFKRKNQDPLLSVEGKSMKSALRFDLETKKVIWGVVQRDPKSKQKLELSLHPQWMNEKKDQLAKKLFESNAEYSYTRIKRSKVNGEWRYSVQLVYAGDPIDKGKHPKGTGNVSHDIGTRDITVVTKDGYKVDYKFCSQLMDLTKFEKKIRVLQRKIDRQKRDNNPDNFNPDGTIKKGARTWKKSNRQNQTEAKLSELHRKQAAHRKFLHGELGNYLRSHGDFIKFEKCSYKGWQSNFGKSIGYTAPASLIAKLKEKFKDSYLEFDTKQTKFSQTCPRCFNVKKKSLSERVHNCEQCGLKMPRNLASAMLAYHVREECSTDGKKTYSIDEPALCKMLDAYINFSAC